MSNLNSPGQVYFTAHDVRPGLFFHVTHDPAHGWAPETTGQRQPGDNDAIREIMRREVPRLEKINGRVPDNRLWMPGGARETL